jgi:hypothetical protein
LAAAARSVPTAVLAVSTSKVNRAFSSLWLWCLCAAANLAC